MHRPHIGKSTIEQVKKREEKENLKRQRELLLEQQRRAFLEQQWQTEKARQKASKEVHNIAEDEQEEDFGMSM